MFRPLPCSYITLFDFQLDAQNSYLFIYNTFIKILYMFRPLPCSYITLVHFQLDAQNSYLFIYNTFIKIVFMFRALPCSSSGGLRRNYVYMQPLVSPLSAGDCPVHRLRKISSFSTGAQESHLQRVTIPEDAYIQLQRRLPDDGRKNARSMLSCKQTSG